MTTAAEVRNLCKQYPGSSKKANNNITLDLRKGEILCIAGENGAGKTTLMKILCGLEKKDSGEVIINGNIGMVHQHFMLFPEFTAAENVVMGNEPRKFGFFFDSKKAKEILDNIIKENNFSIKADSFVKDLSLGEMQQLEICRILYFQQSAGKKNADIIILDEPTSILTGYESRSLFKTLRTLKENGKSIILITHKLHEIKEISDRVAVLRNGELKGIRNVSEIDIDDITQLMMGDKNPVFGFEDHVKKEPCKEPLIVFNNVTVMRKRQKQPLLDNISFNVYKGELLGFAGVSGNGLGVIEAVLGGFLHPVSGNIYYKNNDITYKSEGSLRRHGLSYVPADRIKVGSAQEAAIYENIIINNYKKSKKENYRYSEEIIKKYIIDAPDIRKKASALSGGNLQKLILAREIDRLKDYIVFSQPTWGLDAASGSFIMKEIVKLKEKNAAVILISTDLDEILSLADRIMVMYKGKIAGIYQNDNSNLLKEKIGRSMQCGVFNEECGIRN